MSEQVSTLPENGTNPGPPGATSGLLSLLAIILVLGAVLVIAELEAFGFRFGAGVVLVHVFLIPALGVVLVGLGVVKRRASLRRVGMALLISAVFSLIAAMLVNGIKRANSQAVGDSICLALEGYLDREGRYPDALEELVPDFLAEIPTTNMGVFRTIPFQYSPEEDEPAFWLRFNSTHFLVCSRGTDPTWRMDD